MSNERGEVPTSIYFIGALITSAIGAILLLALDFGGWVGFYLGAWNSIYSFPITISGFLLLYCTVICFLALRFPEKILNKKYVQYGLYLSFLAFILSIIGGIVFAVVLELEDAWWWFDAGLYGGTIGGLLTAIFFYLRLKRPSLAT